MFTREEISNMIDSIIEVLYDNINRIDILVKYSDKDKAGDLIDMATIIRDNIKKALVY